MLNGLQSYCGINLSGLLQIQYAPVSWIDLNTYRPIINTSNNFQYNILFNTGDWLSAPILSKSGKWVENQNRSIQGKYYDTVVSGIMPNMNAAALLEMQQMADYEFILKLEDISGRSWILGTPNNPFLFSSSGTSGDNGSLKHHAIQFEAKLLKKTHGFNPVINN